MPNIKKAILQFDLKDNLSLRYGHKLRGFFAQKFENVLFHNHKDNGKYRYSYPLIQYKIIDGNPTVIGLQEGAELVIKNFLDIKKLILGDEVYEEPQGEIEVIEEEVQVITKLNMPKYKYQFKTPWLGLNEKNHRKYSKKIKQATDEKEMEFFSRILIGNLLAFAKGIDWWVEEEINVVPKLEPIDVKFKDKKMVGFVGEFFSNVSLPEYIGIGNSTARGFGTLEKEELV